VSRLVDFERRNKVAALAEIVARNAQDGTWTGPMLDDAAKGARAILKASGALKENDKRFVIGIEPGAECIVKLRTGSVVRGKYVSDSGPKRVRIDSDGVEFLGELVPES
jgi:hypothetical protein